MISSLVFLFVSSCSLLRSTFFYSFGFSWASFCYTGCRCARVACVQSAHIFTPTCLNTHECVQSYYGLAHITFRVGCLLRWPLCRIQSNTTCLLLSLLTRTEKCNHVFESLTELFALNC